MRAFGSAAALAALTLALAATAGAASHRTTVDLRGTGLGRVLADASGRTLYLFTADKGRTSACYGQCATFWPPLLATAAPLAGPGVKASLLGTTKRKDGKLQVTYAGHPLYLFAKDGKPGQTNGEGVQGSWFAVSAAGTRVVKKAAAATNGSTGATSTPPPTGYGGYGG